jgi:DNA-binding NarL/FixJ family response regulator
MAACIAVEQIERILVKGPRPMRPPHLTEREDAVLRLRSKGYNVPEIAEYLGLSVATVRVHVRKLIARLEAKDLTHSLAVAFRTGILI